MNQDELRQKNKMTESQTNRFTEIQKDKKTKGRKGKSWKDKGMERRMEGIQVLMMIMIIDAGRRRWRRWNTDEIDADGRRLNRCDLEF